jgi:methionine aminopeptidase
MERGHPSWLRLLFSVIQGFGESFSLEKLLAAREVARDITYELSSMIRPGMQEQDAHKLYHSLCQKFPVQKQWHPPKIRFGINTIHNFKDESLPYSLKEEDIFFIDVGPVIKGHEADYGETFILGEVHAFKHIAHASKKIFNLVCAEFAKDEMKGAPLYEFASKEAQEMGYILNLGQDGHRIGDFPHHVHFRGGLPDCEERIIPNAWILEIHLWEPKKQFGAFFEDILTKEMVP